MSEVPLYYLDGLFEAGFVRGVGGLRGSCLQARRLSTAMRLPILYRGTSLTRKRTPLGPYSRSMSRALWGPRGVSGFS